MNTIKWEEISYAADTIFSIWEGHPELEWAKKAWEALTKAGLADYSNELERQRTLIRLMALGVIYGEFCYYAWEESSDPSLSDWAHNLEIEEFRVGQLVGKDFEVKDDDVFGEALKEIIKSSRNEIFEALCKEFDGVSTLFLSLWITGSNEWDEDNPDEAVSNILNNIDGDGGKLAAFQWVSDGMPAVV